jgi:hypothetical protein
VSPWRCSGVPTTCAPWGGLRPDVSKARAVSLPAAIADIVGGPAPEGSRHGP